MAYKASTLLKRPTICAKLKIGELSKEIVVSIRNIQDLYLLKRLGVLKLVHLSYDGVKFDETPRELFCELAESVCVFVRSRVASHPKCPQNLLEKLSTDRDWRVRIGVAENPNAPPHILARLSDDESWEVRLTVARNPSTPLHTLEKLSKDENEFVVKAAVASKRRAEKC